MGECPHIVQDTEGTTFCDLAESSIAALSAERDRLLRWKQEAIQVISEWEKVHDALGKPGHLGESKALASLSEVQRLRAALDPQEESDGDKCACGGDLSPCPTCGDEWCAACEGDECQEASDG